MNELWDYPFKASVWGTFSDFFGVIVTIITAYLLWKTLKSQTDVQRMQEKLLKIEYSKHRLTIMPEFEVIPMDGQGIHGEIAIELICLKAYAEIKRFYIEKGRSINAEKTLITDFSIIPNASIVKSIVKDNHTNNWAIRLKIEYLDEDGNEYYQNFKVYNVEDQVKFSSSLPIAIDKLKESWQRSVFGKL